MWMHTIVGEGTCSDGDKKLDEFAFRVSDKTYEYNWDEWAKQMSERGFETPRSPVLGVHKATEWPLTAHVCMSRHEKVLVKCDYGQYLVGVRRKAQ